MNNPAFEFLRQFKPVTDATEELVTKTIKRKFPEITLEQLIEVFENGIVGEYGKIFTIDPETLMRWVYEYMAKTNQLHNYLNKPLLDNKIKLTDPRFPSSPREWQKETNRCFQAYIKGVNVYEFHPYVYDKLVLDNRLPVAYFERYISAPEPLQIRKGKQQSIGDYFEHMKTSGATEIYTL